MWRGSLSLLCRRRLRRLAMHVATSTLALFVFDLPAAADIRVGLAAPLSGPMAPIGRAMRSTLEAAIREANTSGGLSDKRLTLVVADDACSGATAEQAAASLIQDRPALVIGHPCSGAATRAAALYRQAGVLLIAVDARHPDVTKGGTADPLVLRLAGRDDRQGDAAARWLIQHAPAGRVAIVHDRTAYARAIATRTKAILDAANVGSIVDLGIVAGKRDYPEIVTEIRAARAEAVFFAGFPDEAAIVAAGLAENGPTIPFLGTDSLATPGFADIARRTPNPIHVLLPSNPHALASGADAEGTPATVISGPHHGSAARAQAALEAWLAMAGRMGTTDAKSVGGALRDTPIETRTLGVLRFDKNGDLVGDAFVPASAAAVGWVRER